MSAELKDIILTNRYQINDYFDEWYPGLVVFAQQFLCTKADSEDIVQNAFVKLFENFENEKNIIAAKGYLYRIVRNDCLNVLKHEKVKSKYNESLKNEVFSEKYFLQKIVEEETYSAIYKAMNNLPEQCRKIMTLSVNGLKNDEISEELNISINTVKSQKKIAYSRLREQLKNVYEIVSVISIC